MDLNPNLDPKHLAAAEMMIDNEDFQNMQYSPDMREKVLAGIDCDFLVDDSQTFGRTVDNPIPVNGPYGEHTYLSRLRTSNGQGFFYHRLGSIDRIDQFEVCSFDYRVQEFLYFDMYHPRRSRKAVSGYNLLETPQAWTGFSSRLDKFPSDIFGEYRRAERGRLDKLPSDHHEEFWQPLEMRLFMPDYDQLTDIFEGAGGRFGRTGSFATSQGSSRVDEDEDLGGWEPPFKWSEHITISETQQVNEDHGYIVKSGGERLIRGERFGWYPSKAVAKMRSLNPEQMYDPAVTVLLEGFEAYRTLAGNRLTSSMSFHPKQVGLDKNGLFSTLNYSSEQLFDFVDFLEKYYLPKRTYQLKIELLYAGNYTDGTFYVRWLEDVIGHYNVAQINRDICLDSPTIAKFDLFGNLTFKI